MSLEEKIGQLAGTLTTFMELYSRDRMEDSRARDQYRERDQVERDKFRDDVKASIIALSARLKPLEKASIEDGVPKQVFKFVLQLMITGGVLAVASSGVNWMKGRLFGH